jgi:hypothetical protein
LTNIQRLPLSLKQLVHVTPFRAVDGTLFVGHKSSVILSIDADTGVDVMDGAETGRNRVHLGRTEYTLTIYNENEPTRPLWNVTYVDFDAPQQHRSDDHQTRAKYSPGIDGTLYFGMDATGLIFAS